MWCRFGVFGDVGFLAVLGRSGLWLLVLGCVGCLLGGMLCSVALVLGAVLDSRSCCFPCSRLWPVTLGWRVWRDVLLLAVA